MKRNMFMLSLLVAVLVADVSAEKEPLFIESRQLTAGVLAQIGSDTLAECTKRGFKVAVAIVSRDSQLLYFIRHPLAGAHTIEVSQQKAYTAATTGMATSALTEAYMQKLNHLQSFTTLQGGLPITVGGHQYGGIGVSGATPQADEECATAGMKSVLEELEFSE